MGLLPCENRWSIKSAISKRGDQDKDRSRSLSCILKYTPRECVKKYISGGLRSHNIGLDNHPAATKPHVKREHIKPHTTKYTHGWAERMRSIQIVFFMLLDCTHWKTHTKKRTQRNAHMGGWAAEIDLAQYLYAVKLRTLRNAHTKAHTMKCTHGRVE